MEEGQGRLLGEGSTWGESYRMSKMYPGGKNSWGETIEREFQAVQTAWSLRKGYRQITWKGTRGEDRITKKLTRPYSLRLEAMKVRMETWGAWSLSWGQWGSLEGFHQGGDFITIVLWELLSSINMEDSLVTWKQEEQTSHTESRENLF